jgi:hypothetical protein
METGSGKRPATQWKGGAAPMATQSTPSRSRPARRRKPFTLEEANRTLPLVGRIVRDIVQCHQEAMQMQIRLEAANRSRQPAGISHADLQRTLDRLGGYADELRALGVELKDPENGLVDFPSRHHGREIFLCWRLGEPAIAYWHELQGGYAGRRPVSALAEPSSPDKGKPPFPAEI